MERHSRVELQHLALPTAFAVIYARITGAAPDARNPIEMQLILNDVAHAISNLVPIYAPAPESSVPKELPAADLIDGNFTRGAHVLKTRSGKELRGLTVRRRDMLSAIAILRAAQVKFRRPVED